MKVSQRNTDWFVFDRMVTRNHDMRGAVGPFSSHWAAVAAIIRLDDPAFRSLGGDLPADIALESGLRP